MLRQSVPITTATFAGGIGERAQFQSGRDQIAAAGNDGGSPGVETGRRRFRDRCRGRLAGSEYLLASREKLADAHGVARFEVLRAFVQDWSLLRRGDHSAARLQLDREELDWQRANSSAQKEKEFREWIKRPEVLRELFPDIKPGISSETLKKIERELRLL